MFTKIVAGVVLITVLSVPLAQSSYADVNGWEAAGLVLAGAVGYAIINDAVSSDYQPRHYVGVAVYRRPPVVRTYRVSHRPHRIWIAGHYETVTKKVWVPGYHEKVCVPPVTRRVWVSGRYGRGHWEEEIIRPGRYKRVWREGYYEYRDVEVWVDGYWQYT